MNMMDDDDDNRKVGVECKAINTVKATHIRLRSPLPLFPLLPFTHGERCCCACQNVVGCPSIAKNIEVSLLDRVGG